jgi:uncharacterized membrane protein
VPAPRASATRARHLRRARQAVFAALAALALAFALWHLTRFSARTAALALAVGVAPWLSVARGLWRGERRSHALACLLTVPYLGYGLTEVLANPGARGLAGATVLASCVAFIALVAYLRVSRP